MHLILDTYGAFVEREDFRFKITDGKHERLIAPGKINSISILKNCSISSAALLLAAEHDIPVVIFNRNGKPAVRMWDPYHGSIGTIRRNQMLFAGHDAGVQWLLELFTMKIEEQSQNLLWLAEARSTHRIQMTEAAAELPPLVKRPDEKDTVDEQKNQLMLTDARASRIYWDMVALALGSESGFEKRTRQPAEDPLNATINYLYGMLYSVVEGAVITAGLDPQLGILHADEYHEPTFVFDCIEPFRPWTDRLAMQLLIEDKLGSACFETGEQTDDEHEEKHERACYVSREGKQLIIPAFFGLMKKATLFNGRRIRHEDQIRYLCTQLAQQLKNFQP